MWLLRTDPVLGEPLGGVSTGAGSFDLAFCTLSSRFCILPRKLRSLTMDEDFGNPEAAFEGRGRPALPRLCRYVEFVGGLLTTASDLPLAWLLPIVEAGGCLGVALMEVIDSLLFFGRGVAKG